MKVGFDIGGVWSEDWVCTSQDFGRRVAPQNLKDSSSEK